MMPQFDKQFSSNSVSYSATGSGPNLFLIHGVGLRAESWHPYTDALAKYFRVIIPDLPGHGSSRPLNADYDDVKLGDYVDCMHHFMREFGHTPSYLCGHSLGALIAIELAAKLSTQVQAMIALNTIWQRSDHAYQAVQNRAQSLHNSEKIIGVEETIERWFGKSPPAQMQTFAAQCGHWLANGSLQGYALAYKTFADQRGPSDATIKSIQCPSIYMTGDLDLNSSAQMSRELANLGQRANAKIVKQAGHMMPLTHANDVIDQLIALVV